MSSTSTLSTRLFLGALAMGACLAGAAAQAQAPESADARYQSDVARCDAGQTNQDKATCLREAGAAREEAKRNRLSNHGQDYQKNQTDRCNELPADQRSGCMMQMSGTDTKTEGSVMSGGVLRETTIEVPPGTPGSTLHEPNAPASSAPAQTMPAPTMPAPTQVPGTGVAQ